MSNKSKREQKLEQAVAILVSAIKLYLKVRDRDNSLSEQAVIKSIDKAEKAVGFKV